MIRSPARKIVRKFAKFLFGNKKELSIIEYWKKRSRQYGKRSVLNIGHSEKKVHAVTKMQKDEIFPFLKQQLRGNEKLILDFGCGPGRFTPDLATMIQGCAIGVDPIKYLIDLAPKNGNVEYGLMEEGIIPVKTDSIDVIWICLVLGGITDDSMLRITIDQINRVLKKDGLVFLVENTSEKKDGNYWKFRSVQTYQALFNFVELNHLSDYFDLGERISIMAGRRYV